MENGSQRSSDVFVRGSADYEKHRCAYVNGNVPARYPVEIHVPGDIEGVVRAVKKAQELGARVGVRSGGHLFPCSSLLQDGILVDMSNVNRRLAYDAITHEISFGPAVRVREAAETLLSHRRFFPYGHAPSVALGGFCLAGGQGWFMRGWGATVSQWVTQIEIVLASGEVAVANTQQNRDIFWAARGSGQMFFGIVTKIWGRTIPAKLLFRRTLLFRVEDSFKHLATFGFERNQKSPKYGTETAMCTFYPEKYNPELKGDQVPEKGMLLVIESLAYVDTLEEAETILSAWSDIPSHLQNLLIQNDPVRPTTWAEQFAAQDALVPWGNGERWMCDSILDEPSIPLETVRYIHPWYVGPH